MVAPRLSFITALRGLGLPYERSRSTLTVEGQRWTYRFGTPHGLRAGSDRWFQAAVDVGRPLEATERTPLVESLTAPLRWARLPSPTEDPLVHAAPAVHTRLGVPRPA